MANNMTLLVMAAGMGSRFGGLKQIEPVGPEGQVILEYSVYDALEAGFDKAVFIIKKEIESDFRAIIGKRIEKMIDVEYAFQEIDKIPAPFTVPEGRVKPWGTGHAVLCAKEFVNSPFAVINADDYYGKGGYKVVKDHFDNSNEFCIVGFKLANTVTENGTVSRGICEVVDGYLKSVVETHEIPANNDYPIDTICSMNMWGCTGDIIEIIHERFGEFLDKNINSLSEEFLIPELMDELLREEKISIRLLHTNEKWYGVTYKGDIPKVREALQALADE